MRQPGRGDYPARPLGNIAVEQVGDDIELAFDKGQLRNIEMLTMSDARKLHSLLSQVVEPGGKFIDIVFDGPPSHESGRFIEVEDEHGHSIKVGRWVHHDDGYWALRLPDPRAAVRKRVLMTHPHDGHGSDDTCLDCERADLNETLRVMRARADHGFDVAGECTKLVSAAQNVLALHWGDAGTCGACSQGRSVLWPCPTVKALTDALKGGK
jgi:hypothetical protein